MSKLINLQYHSMCSSRLLSAHTYAYVLSPSRRWSGQSLSQNIVMMLNDLRNT